MSATAARNFQGRPPKVEWEYFTADFAIAPPGALGIVTRMNCVRRIYLPWAIGLVLVGSAQASDEKVNVVSERVGTSATNRSVLPNNQIVTPAGLQVNLPGLRPQGLALSPNGRLLVTAGKDGVIRIWR